MVLAGACRVAAIRPRNPLPMILMGGYALRLFLQMFLRDIKFFSHELGGDCILYEDIAQYVALNWRHTDIHYITSAEWPEMGPTTLPQNLFALVIYLNDGEKTRLGCVALIALAAALTVLNVFKLALELGAREREATIIASIFYFDPAFLYHTSDTFKDGLVICFALGALGSAVRLSRRWSLLHALAGLLCIACLWLVRHYLVFATVAPLIVGLVGIGSRSVVRPMTAALLLAAAGMALVQYTDALQLSSQHAAETFERATSSHVLASSASGGSGVLFDDGGSPTGALIPKLAYTLLSPFFWSAGSVGLQIGKLEAFLWYFIMYRAFRASRLIDGRLLLTLLTFILPLTLAYAMTVANVGLIVRQRLIIVVGTAVLAALYRPQRRPAYLPTVRAIRVAR